VRREATAPPVEVAGAGPASTAAQGARGNRPSQPGRRQRERDRDRDLGATRAISTLG